VPNKLRKASFSTKATEKWLLGREIGVLEDFAMG
jgi:hypothetical protein